MCEKEIQLIAIICLFDFVCGTQNLVSSFDFQEGHLDNPVKEDTRWLEVKIIEAIKRRGIVPTCYQKHPKRSISSHTASTNLALAPSMQPCYGMLVLWLPTLGTLNILVSQDVHGCSR